MENKFTIINIVPSAKSNYVIVDLVYDGSTKVYRYSRRVYYNTVLIDGKRVYFDSNYNVVKIKNQYHVEGKKKVQSGGCKSNNEFHVPEAKVETTKDVNKVGGQVFHSAYNDIKTCLECNIPVYLAGPAGAGKNYTVEQIAKHLGWNFYFSNSIQQEYKLTGFIDAGGKFHETEFYKACTDDNDCIFFLDELDASDESVAVLLNAAIANGYFEFPNGRVNLNHVHFVAAGNTVGSGADELYVGRTVLDQSTLDRFAIIQFDYDRNVELSITNNNVELVDFVRELRKQAVENGIRATFSLRCLTMVGKLESKGMALDKIMIIAVMKGLDKDTIQTFRFMGTNKYIAALEKVQRAA